MDRVKQSMERLDIPECYFVKSGGEENLTNNKRTPVWGKGSFADIFIFSGGPPDIVVESQYVNDKYQLSPSSTTPLGTF